MAVIKDCGNKQEVKNLLYSIKNACIIVQWSTNTLTQTQTNKQTDTYSEHQPTGFLSNNRDAYTFFG